MLKSLRVTLAFFPLIILIFFMGIMPASAVEVTGHIQGTVTDPSGAAISGAKITVTNTATGIIHTVTSADDGSYQFLQLPAPATYNITCRKARFKLYQAKGIHIDVTQTYVQNIQMALGEVSQEITVEAAPVQVQKTSMQLGATLTGSQVINLPLNGRNWVQLQQTMPGVVAADNGRGNYATNGSQPSQNSYLVNGIDSNDITLNTPLVIPSPDAIAQVKMITSTINPEYGRNSGAIMDAVTKSGSNHFHGDVFEFYRDTGLNARNFFQPTSIVFHQHQFGATLGGPIKKDKAFFFYSYQGTRNRIPDTNGTGTTTVFTQAQRNGYFPDIATSSALSPFPLVGEDGKTYPAGTAYSTIFPTGHIPTTDFNPISANLVKTFVPLPNSGTEYTFNPVQADTINQHLVRIDENLSSRDDLWGSWLYQHNDINNTLPFTGSTLPGFPDTSTEQINQLALTWNHTFNGSTLNEMRLGYTRFNYDASEPVNILTPQSVGFTGIDVQNPAVSTWPRIAVSGFFGLGGTSNGPQPRLVQTRQFNDNFTKLVGAHTFKVGTDVRTFQVYNPFYTDTSGYFHFDSSGKYSTGDAGANFLLGIPHTYAQSGGDIVNARAQDIYSYFQDQWKIRPNLTLTYGTGWSIDTPLVDNYHSNHAMIAFRPGEQSTIYPNAPAGYVFQGDPGVHASGTTKWAHFAPRIGFAWSPRRSGDWSVRGGFGIYYNRSVEEQDLQFILSPPFGVFSGGVSDYSTATNTYVPGFADPWTDIAGGGTFPDKFPAVTNPAPSVNFAQYFPMSINVQDPHNTVPYSENFNLTIQRRLPGSAVLSLAYVGELGRHEIITRELNPANPTACLTPGPLNPLQPDGNTSCVDSVPFQNSVPAGSGIFRYNSNIFASVGNVQTTGISNYNAFQATYSKHMSHGLALYAAYTWSHAMDNGSGFENAGFGGGGFGAYGTTRGINPFNQTLYDYGPSAYDARNRLVVDYTYVIPPIHHFQNWAAKRFFDGWTMSGVTTFQSGFPLDVADSSNFLSLACTAYSFYECPGVPNLVAPVKYLNPETSSVNGQNHYFFTPSSFAPEKLGTFGNAGRNLLRGPGIANFDWAFMKDTRITESTRLQLRFEFYNLFNHTQFDPSGAVTDISSSNFGRILAARDPRLIQLGAKFYF